jgi:hypothetical protein
MSVFRSSRSRRSILAALAVTIAALCAGSRCLVASAHNGPQPPQDARPVGLGTVARLAFCHALGAALSWLGNNAQAATKRAYPPLPGWQTWPAALGGLLLLAAVSGLLALGSVAGLRLAGPLPWLSVNTRLWVSHFLMPP